MNEDELSDKIAAHHTNDMEPVDILSMAWWLEFGFCGKLWLSARPYYPSSRIRSVEGYNGVFWNRGLHARGYQMIPIPTHFCIVYPQPDISVQKFSPTPSRPRSHCPNPIPTQCWHMYPALSQPHFNSSRPVVISLHSMLPLLSWKIFVYTVW